MDKRVMLAVAGSGKTTYIADQLQLSKRALVVTYTQNNYNNLKQLVIEKFGHYPSNISMFTYFRFLYSFCYKPFLHDKFGTKGITFDKCPNKYATGCVRYIDKYKRLYSNRLAALMEKESVAEDVTNRLSKYFDQIFIDEIQDFGGHDFDFLESIVEADVEVLFVGDFYQHTFDTSRDGNKNANLYGDYVKYQNRFSRMNLRVDTESLQKSYRCSQAICKFVSDKLGIYIESHQINQSDIRFENNKCNVIELLKDDDVVKLFYQESRKYPYYSRNWGETKGENKYDAVCVILNPTTLKKFQQEQLSSLSPVTKSKLYVAITRARGNLYFVSEKMCKSILSQ